MMPSFEIAVLFCRYLLLLVLLFAVYGKLSNKAGFCSNLQEIFAISPHRAMLLYVAIVVSESLVGMALLYGHNLLLIAFVMAGVMFFLMALFLLVMLVRHQVFKCNCFGETHHTVNYGDVLRNLILVFAAGFGVLIGEPPHSSGAEQLLMFMAALPVCLVIVFFSDISLVFQWREHKS